MSRRAKHFDNCSVLELFLKVSDCYVKWSSILSNMQPVGQNKSCEGSKLACVKCKTYIDTIKYILVQWPHADPFHLKWSRTT